MNPNRLLVSTGREVAWPILLIVLAFTLSHYTALAQRLSIMAAIRNELLLGLACLASALWVIISDPMSLGPGRRVAIAFGVFFATVAIQVPFAMDRASASYMFYDAVLKQSIFTFYVAVLLRSPRHVAAFLATYLFALFWVLQEAVRGLITGSLVWYNQGIHRLHGAIDRYRHPNGISLAGQSTLPFLYYMRRVWTRRWMQLALLAILTVATLCIVYSGSRAGYVTVLAMVFLIWLANEKKVRNLFILGVLAVVAVFAMPEQYKNRFETIGGEEIQGASQDARILLMQDAWETFLKYPYGVGVDSFIYVRLTEFPDRRRQDVHNLYLQILSHLGLQGLLAFGCLIVTLFQCHAQSLARVTDAASGLRRGAREGTVVRDRRLRRFLFDLRVLEMAIRGVRFFMIAMLINGVFAHTIYHIMWYFVVGVSVATASTAEHLSGVTRRFWRANELRLTDDTEDSVSLGAS